MGIKLHKKFKPSINFNVPKSMHVQQGKVKNLNTYKSNR